MAFQKLVFSKLLNASLSRPTEIIYWDGKKEKLGEGETEFQLKINAPLDWNYIREDASIALAEAYMHRDIELEGDLQAFVTNVFENKESFLQDQKFVKKILGKHDKKTSKEDISHHYNIGNDFYRHWLDDSMTYSCAYFKKEEDTLHQAQKQQKQHLFKKLRLQKEDHLLDIGCGWGELIIMAAKQYGLKATGCTLSQEQYEHVQKRIYDEGLEGQVQVKLTDYRDLVYEKERYNKIVSVGMVEHVGKENIDQYIEVINELLEEPGLALVHGITGQRDPDDPKKGTNGFLLKYIFPGGYIPAVSELVKPMNVLALKLIDIESLRRHYQKTLEIWNKRFEDCWGLLIEEKGEPFMRMWSLYLQSCAAIFESGNLDICQYLLEKGVDNSRPLTREYML